MAVFQISRIQIRRGRATQGTGLPQLASGEMAWAIDTQELYIGGGSVDEGAPAVKNVKILTANDLNNTSGLIQTLQYVYKNGVDPSIQTGLTANLPISRSIQSRLDDQVTATDFGVTAATVDTHTDSTLTLQHAIDQLFLNSPKASALYSAAWPVVSKRGQQTEDAVAKRVTLNIPAGVYNLTEPLYVPSYATIIGAGPNKTILEFNPSASLTVDTEYNYAILRTSVATTKMLGAAVSSTAVDTNSGDLIIPDGNGIPGEVNLLNSYIDGNVLHVGTVGFGTLQAGQLLFGTGIRENTYLVENLSGVGNGSTWTVTVPQGATYTQAATIGTIFGTGVILSALVDGSINNTTFSAPLAPLSGVLQPGQLLTGIGIAPNTYILRQIGTGGITWEVSVSQYVSTGRVTATGAVTLVKAPNYASTGTVLELALMGSAIEFVNDSSEPGAPSPLSNTSEQTHARYITMKDLTIKTVRGDNTCLQLDAVTDSHFEDITLIGSDTQEALPPFNTSSTGVTFNSNGALLFCKNNLFKNIKFYNFTFGVYGPTNIENNIFENCVVHNSHKGFVLGYNFYSQFDSAAYVLPDTMASSNQITNSLFDTINEHAVMIGSGTGNTVQGCRLIGVGNNGGASPVYPQIYISMFGNSVLNNYSDRTEVFATDANLATADYIPEFAGQVNYDNFSSHVVTGITHNTSPVFAFRLPVYTDETGNIPLTAAHAMYTINYSYTSSDTYHFVRKGTLNIAASTLNNAGNLYFNTIQLSDEYNFAGADGTLGDGSPISAALDFQASYRFANGNLYDGTNIPGSIGVYYKNLLPDDNGKLDYTVSVSFFTPN